MKLLITGGAGFIGSNFIRYILNKYPDYQVVNLDKLTYCGNLDNLKDIENDPRYEFIRGDICDKKLVDEVFARGIDGVTNFAAETHVDRSILDPEAFIKTDVLGTHVLLEAARKFNIKKYVQISTDECYGSIKEGSSKETDIVVPRSPYSASKTAGDLLVLSYFTTYGLPVLVTRGSNTYGGWQYPEKLIPLFVTNLLEGKKVPLYGDGLNIRDWIYVLDHCSGIDTVLHGGKVGEIYNIGGGNEKTNLEITKIVLGQLGKDESSIKYVKDRPGHDRRYSLDTSKIKELGWQSKYSFEGAMRETIDWYKNNQWWWKKIKSGEYLEYYKKQYGK